MFIFIRLQGFCGWGEHGARVRAKIQELVEEIKK